MTSTIRSVLVVFLLLPLGLFAQTSPGAGTTTIAAGASSATRRTFLQWTEMRGPRTQIFIDLNGKEKLVYEGANPQMKASLLLSLPGDGTVSLMKYQGMGDDWKWTPVAAHAVLSHPAPGIDRVEFDYLPLGSSTRLAVVFQSLDKDWKVVSASKVLPWRPN